MKKAAFSLVELSIVLVILGLLVGGVLSGRSLIRAAELRRLTTELSVYETALNTFYLRYNAIPGDMRNAEDFWGTASACPNGAGTDKQTCNGNGNNIIDNASGIYHEPHRGWQHLSNSGLITGNYTGRQNAAPNYVLAGENVPASAISGAGYTLANLGAGNAYGGMGNNMLWGTQSHSRLALFLGGQTGDAMRRANILTPAEAYSIDLKTDDGKPDQGVLQSGPIQSACNTTDTSPADYALTNQNMVCMLVYHILR